MSSTDDQLEHAWSWEAMDSDGGDMCLDWAVPAPDSDGFGTFCQTDTCTNFSNITLEEETMIREELNRLT